MAEAQGKLVVIGDEQQFGTKGFRVRKFVIEIENERDPNWNQFREMQLTQDNCDLIDPYKLGDEVKAEFNLNGRKYEKDGVVKYFNSDVVWKVEMVQAAAPQQPTQSAPQQTAAPAYVPPQNTQAQSADNEEDNDLPF